MPKQQKNKNKGVYKEYIKYINSICQGMSHKKNFSTLEKKIFFLNEK